MKAFGTKVVAYDPYVTSARAQQLGVQLLSLDELIETSDFITIHMPKTPETTGMIGTAQLKAMKPTAYVINVARGGLIDEDALYEALKAGHVAGGTVVTFRIQTVGVLELGVFHAELGGPGVHQAGEGVGAARQVFGHGDAGVVAGLDDDALVEVIDGDLLAHLDKHLGGVGVVFGPGVLADGHHVGVLDVSFQQLVTNDVGGHHLGQAGGRQAFIGVGFCQYLARVVVDQNMGLGGDLRRGRHHHGGAVQGGDRLGSRQSRIRRRYRLVGLGGRA